MKICDDENSILKSTNSGFMFYTFYRSKILKTEFSCQRDFHKNQIKSRKLLGYSKVVTLNIGLGNTLILG